MDGKRLMARNVYQVFRCFRNIIRFSYILASRPATKILGQIKLPPKPPTVVVTVHISKGSLHKVRESLQASFVQLFYFAASALCSTTRELSFPSLILFFYILVLFGLYLPGQWIVSLFHAHIYLTSLSLSLFLSLSISIYLSLSLQQGGS